jgi:hypothetical protein
VQDHSFSLSLEQKEYRTQSRSSYNSQVLIEGYDHLCPWTGTGIGHGNMFAFKAFVVSVNVLCYFSIALVAYALLNGLVVGT